MPIPTYEEALLPILNYLADGQVHTTKEIQAKLTEYFSVTPEELDVTVPSGQAKLFLNRVGWALTYLKKAGLIVSPQSRQYQFTLRGQNVLATTPERLTAKDLMQYPEFGASRNTVVNTDTSNAGNQDTTEMSTKTPEELIEEGYQIMRSVLAEDLLQKIATQSPSFFEQAVLDLLVRMGYGGSLKDAAQIVGKSGDEGIDGIIKEDSLGLDVIYVQAKRWKNNVGSPEIQGFIGALQLKGAHKGIFITTSAFTPPARDVANRVNNRIVLIDGQKLANLMIEYGVGVTTETVYEVKRINNDYFVE